MPDSWDNDPVYCILHYTVTTGKLFSVIPAFVRTHTHTLFGGESILNGMCTCFYFIPFIATFKGHGHALEISLEFHFFFYFSETFLTCLSS